MVTYTDIVVLELEAKLGKYNAAILEGQRKFDSAMSSMSKNLKSFEGRTQTSFVKAGSSMITFGKLAVGALAGSALVGVAQKYVGLADEATKMANALKIAGLEGEAAAKVYDKLYASAQRNFAPVNSLVDLYSKLSLSQSALGVSSEELISFTDNISVALRVAGTDSVTASGALLQLSQALGGGIVRAEEFNSMMEGTPTIVQAVARGLKEAGGSVAELRKLVNDGKVSSEAYFRAFQVGSGQLQQQAATSQATVGQSFVRLKNSLLTIVSEFDRTTGASGRLADGIVSLSQGLDHFDVEGFVNQVQRVIDKVMEAERAGTSWLNSIGNSSFFAELAGGTDGGPMINPDVSEAESKIADLERQVEVLVAKIESNSTMYIDNTDALASLRAVEQELASIRAQAQSLPAMIAGIRRDGSFVPYSPKSAPGTDSGSFYTGEGYSAPKAATQTYGQFYNGSNYAPPAKAPVSIEDYPPGGPAKPKKRKGGGGGGRKGGGGGGGGGSGYDLQEEIKLLEQKTKALRAETEALSTLDPVAEDYEQQVSRVRVEQELLAEAQKAGIELTPQVRASILSAAEAYAAAEKASKDLTDAQEKLKNEAEEWETFSRNVMSSFIGDLVAGVSATDALRSALGKLAEKLADSAFDRFFTQSGASNWGAAAVKFLTGGRASGGNVKKGHAYEVNENTPNSEIFVAPSNGAILNVPQAQEALSRSSRGFGGAFQFAPQTNITVSGNMDDDTMEKLRRELDARDRKLKQEMPGYLKQQQLKED